MATKLYLRNTANDQSGTYPSGSQTTSPITPDYTATGGTSIKKMLTTKGSSQTSMTGASSATTSAQVGLYGMWTSEPLAAQTIANAGININIANSESNLAMNLGIDMTAEIYVWRPSTGAKVGTLHHNADYSGDAEPAAASTEKVNYATFGTNTSVTAQSGDVIIAEIVQKHTQSMGVSYNGIIYYDGTTENTTTNTTVSDHASYVEFGHTLTFAGAGISCDANITFDNMTVTSDADVAVVAASSITFANMTITADADVAVVANASVTFDAMTITATATPEIAIFDANITFADMTVSSAGTVNVAAASSITFADMTVSSDADVAVVATSTITFSDMTVSSEGDVFVVANSTTTFDDMTVTATAVVGAAAIEADANITFDDMTISSTVAALIAAASVITFDSMTVSSEGSVVVSGSSNITFDGMTVTSGASVAVIASANITFDNMTLIAAAGQEVHLVGIEAFVSGYDGALGDQISNFLMANGATQSSVEDMWMQFFAAQGVTQGTLLDRMRAFLVTYTGAVDTGQTIEDLWSLVTGPFVP